MINYDAGPGDYNDPEWKGPKSKAKRPRVVLPLWVHLVVLVGIVILLCVGLVLIVRAIRGGGAREAPTPAVTATAQVPPTETAAPMGPTATIEPATPTVVLPTEAPVQPPAPTEIGPGATVVVKGTGARGLNLRAQPTTQSERVATVNENAELTVIVGPQEADGFVWWQVETADGKQGWGAADWLVLKVDE